MIGNNYCFQAYSYFLKPSTDEAKSISIFYGIVILTDLTCCRISEAFP